MYLISNRFLNLPPLIIDKIFHPLIFCLFFSNSITGRCNSKFEILKVIQKCLNSPVVHFTFKGSVKSPLTSILLRTMAVNCKL